MFLFLSLRRLRKQSNGLATRLTTTRYKAVNDLLYHNNEAFNGIPELFSWMGIGDETVYFEFLDNDVRSANRRGPLPMATMAI